MNPIKEKYYRSLFAVAAIYDIVLGIAFIFFRHPIYGALGISDKLPAFGGYVTLLGAFVLVLGVAYGLISRGDLRQNADLILVGALYKAAYATTAFYYWAHGNLPHVAFGAVFGVADVIFLVLMAECYWSLEKKIKG